MLINLIIKYVIFVTYTYISLNTMTNRKLNIIRKEVYAAFIIFFSNSLVGQLSVKF